jgi:hypothetical protein
LSSTLLHRVAEAQRALPSFELGAGDHAELYRFGADTTGSEVAGEWGAAAFSLERASLAAPTQPSSPNSTVAEWLRFPRSGVGRASLACSIASRE